MHYEILHLFNQVDKQVQLVLDRLLQVVDGLDVAQRLPVQEVKVVDVQLFEQFVVALHIGRA